MTLDGYIESLRGKRVAVVGVGVSNRPLIELLLGAHLNVSVRDMRPAEKLGAEAGGSSPGGRATTGVSARRACCPRTPPWSPPRSTAP